MSTRQYTTRRLSIVNALAEELKKIDGSGNFKTDVATNVSNRLKYWDEINEFPSICLSCGVENRVYQAGGFKERYLTIKVTCYVNDEDPVAALDYLLEDVETVLEDSSRLMYTTQNGSIGYTTMITINSIDTDEGVMAPLGIGEILCEVRY